MCAKYNFKWIRHCNFVEAMNLRIHSLFQQRSNPCVSDRLKSYILLLSSDQKMPMNAVCLDVLQDRHII